jgi:hypothetical protein
MTKARTTSPLTRNQKKKMSEVPSEVKLRKVVPEVPREEVERGELLEDLQVMGCSGCGSTDFYFFALDFQLVLKPEV